MKKNGIGHGMDEKWTWGGFDHSILHTDLAIDPVPGDVRAEMARASARALRSRPGLAAHASAGVLAKNSLAAGLWGMNRE